MAKKLKKGHQGSRKGKHRVPVPSKGGIPQHNNASNETEARNFSQAKDCSCSHTGKAMDSNEGSLNKMKSKKMNKKKGKGADVVTEISAAVHENVDGGDGNYAARGLVNLGNTCFFNSVLQNLLSMKKMRNYFMNMGVPPFGPLTASLQKMFVEACDCVKQRNAMNPRPLFACLCAKASQFRGYEQHDSHELLLCFLDGLSMEELNGKKTTTTTTHENSDLRKDGTVVDALFGGRISSTVRCMECGHTSTVHEPFLDLSLPLPEKKKKKKNPASNKVSGKMKSPLKKGRRVRCTKSKETAVRVTEETGKSRDQSASSLRLDRVSPRTRSNSQLRKKEANGATEDRGESSAVDSSEFDGFGGLFDEPGVAAEDEIAVLKNGSDPESAEVDHADSPVSLESCLAHFTKPELLLNKHARYRCENCSGSSSSSSDGNGASPDVESDSGRSRNATKRILIDRLPQILTVHLKRFGQDDRGRLRKLNGHVVFKNSIDVGPYTTDSVDLCREGGACATSMYRLIGVVEHMGTMSNGHYVSYTKGDARSEREDDDDDDDDDSGFIWYYASDNHVRQASLGEVLLSEAYILFYERQNNTSMEK